MLTIGSLFSGYGGLERAVAGALGNVRTAWVSDIEPGPRKILAQRFPDAPNLGDITTIDWTDVEPVDIIAGGSPCQDLSAAGQRRGMKPGTRSGLWESMTHAIETIQPRLVVWENVLGALSADAYSLSDLEPGAGPLGNRSDGPLLRALGRVLGDLTNLGYDAAWTTFRASDVGAPHSRRRVFVVAYPHESGSEEWGQSLPVPQEEPAAVISDNLLPTPQARDGKGIPGDGFNASSLPREVALLPTPTAQAGKQAAADRGPGTRDDHNLWSVVARKNEWGKYAPAIHQWEQILGRPAPPPTAGGRLSPRFVEWMMGLPQGWVTDVDISRAQQLRALGNGVVPPQCAAALRMFLHDITCARTAA